MNAVCWILLQGIGMVSSRIDPPRSIKITKQKEKEEETDLFRTGRVSPCLNRKDNRHRLRLQPLASFAQIEFHRRNSRRIVPCGSLWSPRVMDLTRVMRVSYPNTLVPGNQIKTTCVRDFGFNTLIIANIWRMKLWKLDKKLIGRGTCAPERHQTNLFTQAWHDKSS
jgi:hypothetical protein